MSNTKSSPKPPHQNQSPTNTSQRPPIKQVLFVIFLVFLGVSARIHYGPGEVIGQNFGSFMLQMVKILPAIFILIGLFEVWVKRETIVKHLGHGGGIKSYLWVFILAAPMAGGMLPALPMGYALHQKGARLTVVLAFLGAVGVDRVPMMLFEASFLGWKFTVLRLLVATPIVLVSSVIIGRIFESRNYELPLIDEA